MTTRRNSRLFTGVLGIGAALMLSGCGGGGGSSPGTGSLSLGITDSPVLEDVPVCIHFTSITLHHSDGETNQIPFDSSSYYDPGDGCKDNVDPKDPNASNNAVALSALQGVLSVQLMDAVEVKAGKYDWIRLDVDESLSYVVDSTGMRAVLVCPSCGADQSGLKLNRGITVPAGGEASFMIDYDLAKSLNKLPSGDYKLRPTLRLVDMAETGTISGSVAGSLITTGMVSATDTGCKVYVYDGHDVTPDDIDVIGGDNVLTTAKVLYDADTATYGYVAAWLPTDTATDPTPYTVALTCDADDPDVDENNNPAALTGSDVIFTDGTTSGTGQNADVSTGGTTTINFPPTP